MEIIKELNILGIVTLFIYLYFSYKIINEDLNTFKIPNKLNLKMLKFFLFIFVIYCIILINNSGNSFLGLIKLYLIHVILSIIGGYTLWYSDYWPAGDAKFYILSMLYIPLILLPNSSRYYPLYLWLTSMGNAFFLATIYVLVKFIINILYFEKDKLSFKPEFLPEKSENLLYYLKTITINTIKILIFFVFGKFINIFFKNLFASLFERPEFIYFFIFFFWEDMENNLFNKKAYKIASIFFYILYFGVMIYYNPTILASQLITSFKYAGILTIIVTLLKEFFDKIVMLSSIDYLKISEIKEGMILSEKEIEKIRQVAPHIYETFKDYNLLKGLTSEQIKALNRFVFELNLNKMEFEVYKIKSFSIWIFAGCLIHIVFDFNLMGIFKF